MKFNAWKNRTSMAAPESMPTTSLDPFTAVFSHAARRCARVGESFAGAASLRGGAGRSCDAAGCHLAHRLQDDGAALLKVWFEGKVGVECGVDSRVHIAAHVSAAFRGGAMDDEVVHDPVGGFSEGSLAIARSPGVPHGLQDLRAPQPLVKRLVDRHVQVGIDETAHHGAGLRPRWVDVDHETRRYLNRSRVAARRACGFAYDRYRLVDVL